MQLKLAKHESKNKVKNEEVVVSMIYKAIEEHSIIPDEFAEVGGPDKTFQLIAISSDGAHLQA